MQRSSHASPSSPCTHNSLTTNYSVTQLDMTQNQTPQEQLQYAASTLSTIQSTLASAQSTPLTKQANDKMVQGQIRYLDTASAYDLWSEVYDTDGNFLQALDTIEMKSLLPQAISVLHGGWNGELADERQIKAVDLGCGTGRSTLQLLPIKSVTRIDGLELSPKMLEIARQRCTNVLEQKSRPTASESESEKRIEFHIFDMLKDTLPDAAMNANLAISTLVLEHVPLQTFFRTAASILRPGGIIVMTNMHAEMGKISQAGFVDAKTGDKIRPVSYAHTVRDTLREAEEWGFLLEGEVKEVQVEQTLAEKLGPRGRKWIGVTVWYGGIWKKVR